MPGETGYRIDPNCSPRGEGYLSPCGDLKGLQAFGSALPGSAFPSSPRVPGAQAKGIPPVYNIMRDISCDDKAAKTVTYELSTGRPGGGVTNILVDQGGGSLTFTLKSAQRQRSR